MNFLATGSTRITTFWYTDSSLLLLLLALPRSHYLLHPINSNVNESNRGLATLWLSIRGFDRPSVHSFISPSNCQSISLLFHPSDNPFVHSVWKMWGHTNQPLPPIRDNIVALAILGFHTQRFHPTWWIVSCEVHWFMSLPFTCPYLLLNWICPLKWSPKHIFHHSNITNRE